MRNCIDDIYPFDDCCHDKTCVKTDIMILSAVSKLQSDCDKITKQVNDNTEELSKIRWAPLMIDLK